MPIGSQLMRNIENSTSKYERKQTEFEKNLVSFHQNHRQEEYTYTQRAMRAMMQNKVLHAEKRY
ncbi:hypothetical protein CIL05_03265 [Virgibacillus profundi]|uniref:Uncharacterized protein n=1 Tax=Virgibacillus profundi TaxID=2024555 RepID=A0A2A2II15_9BACI|nr:hypothetical protein [Virgibacillus profundi]PAV30755.1 hypothetical protein CIL05_03265 [Virgibacillus profundi]PXY54938.1 hypothetical protein CIT14_03345 [Virgibacillus profundi]